MTMLALLKMGQLFVAFEAPKSAAGSGSVKVSGEHREAADSPG